MKNILYLFVLTLVFSWINQAKNIEIEKSAGVLELSGDKYTLGSDEDVEIVKTIIKSFNSFGATKMSKLIADTISFYPHNSPNVVKLPNDAIETFTSQYDSVKTKSIHFLPYSNGSQGKSILQTIQNENLYYQGGKIDSLHVLNLWFIKGKNKIYSIRQFNA